MTILAALIGFLMFLKRATPPSAEGPAIHNRSISLNLTHQIECRASPSIEHRIVFHCNNPGLDGVEGRASFRQDAEATIRRDPDSTKSSLVKLGRPIPSSSMNYDYRLGSSHDHAATP